MLVVTDTWSLRSALSRDSASTYCKHKRLLLEELRTHFRPLSRSSLSTLAVSSPPGWRHETSSSGRRKLPAGDIRVWGRGTNTVLWAPTRDASSPSGRAPVISSGVLARTWRLASPSTPRPPAFVGPTPSVSVGPALLRVAITPVDVLTVQSRHRPARHGPRLASPRVPILLAVEARGQPGRPISAASARPSRLLQHRPSTPSA
jgi:hypothetical protein